MIRAVMLLLFMVVTAGTAGATDVPATPKTTIGQVTPGGPVLYEHMLQPRFRDGTPIRDASIVKVGDTYKLVRVGDVSAGCFTDSVDLEVDGDNLTISRAIRGERCRGRGCRLCTFADDGGCQCESQTIEHGMCFHEIITRSSVDIVLPPQPETPRALPAGS